MTAADPLAAAVEAMWDRNADRVRTRLGSVIAGVELLADGGDPGAEAEQEAHVLSGVLGTYGRPGSELLRRAELALGGSSRAEAAALVRELRSLAAELRG